MNEIFLSAIDIVPRLDANKVNMVYAPVGSGKSSWAEKQLIPSVNDKREILYLTDTTAGRDQALNDNKNDLTEYSKEWYRMMNGIYMPEAWGDYYNFPDNSVPIMTYSKMAHLIKGNGNRFGIKGLKHIILDECHNLKIYQSFNRGKGKDNVLLVLEKWLKNVMSRTDIKITALSATPNKVYTMFDHKNVKEILTQAERDSLRTLKNKKEKGFASMPNLLSNLPDGRGVIYTSHIHKMKEYAEHIKKFYKTKKVDMIWSRYNENHIMDDRQWSIWDSILRHSRIPDDTDILLINASCQTGINIRTPVDYFIIDEWDADTITQARGRIRNDLDLLLLPSKNPDYFYLPSDLLGVRIYQEDKDKVINHINRRNDGHLKRWITVGNMIRQSDTYGFDINPNTGKDHYRDYKGKDRIYRIIKLRHHI